MKPYLDLLRHVAKNGVGSVDRTGVGTVSIFAPGDMRFDLGSYFPLLTARKMSFTNIVNELLWFLSGSTNVNDLPDITKPWWQPWADESGDLGPIYGAQWRNWDGYIDQIQDLIDGIKASPRSRRHIVSSWNVGDVDSMGLPPCHTFFQVYVREGVLSLRLYQRSGDMFLGIPNNIASYSLLTMLLAKHTGNKPGMFIHSIGDAHIYMNHAKQVQELLTRSTANQEKVSITINDAKDIFSHKKEDFLLSGYHPEAPIKGELAV